MVLLYHFWQYRAYFSVRYCHRSLVYRKEAIRARGGKYDKIRAFGKTEQKGSAGFLHAAAARVERPLPRYQAGKKSPRLPAQPSETAREKSHPSECSGGYGLKRGHSSCCAPFTKGHPRHGPCAGEQSPVLSWEVLLPVKQTLAA